MSAFNDYCIVCEKICTGASAYCSDECKGKDSTATSTFNFNNVPQLISPMLQPRNDSITSTLHASSHVSREPSDEEQEEDEEPKIQDYLIKSPMLLSSTLKNEPTIAGLDLDECTPRESKQLDQHHTDLLAASSNYYKKWLNVNQL